MINLQRTVSILGLLCTLTAATQARASSLQTDTSSLAILTDKEGIASALAHRHIIVAGKWTGQIDLGSVDQTSENILSSVTSGKASISIPAAELIVDSPDAAVKIIPVLKSANLWGETDKLAPDNASTVRDNMLDASQLDAKKFATIEGSGAFSSCTKKDDALTCKLTLTLVIKEKNVTKEIPLEIRKKGSSLTATFVGSFAFSEFGMKPYSAMLGAIAVKDRFYVAASLAAAK